jgi:nitrate/nitrite transport system ATP-binding protein
MEQRYVLLENVHKVFDTRSGRFVALRDVNLAVRQGEFVSIIGHSGCGKSTLLNLISGLTDSSGGVLVCAGREIAGPGPDRAVVFQNHSLLPWMTCFENVYLAVERVFSAKEARADLRRRTNDALELVGLGHAAHKYPHEISGGMKQRVGIARALSMQPKVLLLDEPLGALDALTRAHLQDEILRIVAATGCTTIMVTHDVDEAVLLSDRIVMMTNGTPSGGTNPPAAPGEALSAAPPAGATIGQILSVDLPRPRVRLKLADDPVYNRCRSEVLKFLYERQNRPEERAA